MNLGEALQFAREGKRITRAAWRSGAWVCDMGPTTIPAAMVNTRTRKFLPEGDLHVGGYFVVFIPSAGVWQSGWHASPADVDANDWMAADADAADPAED